MNKHDLTDEHGQPKFAATLIPEMWTDIDRVLARTPRALDILRVPTCPAFAAAAKQHLAIPLLLTMQSVAKRHYLPLFFEVLRAASLRPLVEAPRPHAAAPTPIDPQQWAAQYEVPWRNVGATERPRLFHPTPAAKPALREAGTIPAK